MKNKPWKFLTMKWICKAFNNTCFKCTSCTVLFIAVISNTAIIWEVAYFVCWNTFLVLTLHSTWIRWRWRRRSWVKRLKNSITFENIILQKLLPITSKKLLSISICSISSSSSGDRAQETAHDRTPLVTVPCCCTQIVRWYISIFADNVWECGLPARWFDLPQY